MCSIKENDNYVKLYPPAGPSTLLSWVGILMTNILCQAQLNKEAELEMAKILYEFVENNFHLMSNPVTAAAKVLLEEIKRAEQEPRNV